MGNWQRERRRSATAETPPGRHLRQQASATTTEDAAPLRPLNQTEMQPTVLEKILNLQSWAAKRSPYVSGGDTEWLVHNKHYMHRCTNHNHWHGPHTLKNEEMHSFGSVRLSGESWQPSEKKGANGRWSMRVFWWPSEWKQAEGKPLDGPKVGISPKMEHASRKMSKARHHRWLFVFWESQVGGVCVGCWWCSSITTRRCGQCMGWMRSLRYSAPSRPLSSRLSCVSFEGSSVPPRHMLTTKGSSMGFWAFGDEKRSALARKRRTPMCEFDLGRGV